MQYPSDWNERRKEVYERDGYECQRCGEEGGKKGDVELHAHHIKPISQGGSHDLNNLKTVCESCHQVLHSYSTSMSNNSMYTNWEYPFEKYSEQDPVSEKLDNDLPKKTVDKMRERKASELKDRSSNGYTSNRTKTEKSKPSTSTDLSLGEKVVGCGLFTLAFWIPSEIILYFLPWSLPFVLHIVFVILVFFMFMMLANMDDVEGS